MSFLFRLVINAIALFVLSYFHVFGIHADSTEALLVGAVVLGVVNAIIRPILVVLSCPLIILTLGLFTLIINGLIFYYVLRALPGWHIPDYIAAFLGAIVMSVISWPLSIIVRDVTAERRRYNR